MEFIPRVNPAEEFLEIYLYDSQYRHTNDMRSCISSVLQNHKLGTSIITPEMIKNLRIKLLLKSGVNIQIGCRQYPLILLWLDPAKYEQDDLFDKELFMKHLYHEFTHLIDRRNPIFGITERKEQNAENLLSDFKYLLKDLWNLYIDGRLWRRDIKVKSFKDYMDGWFGKKLAKGWCIDSDVIKLYKKAWNAEKLTYARLVSLAKKIGNPLRTN